MLALLAAGASILVARDLAAVPVAPRTAVAVETYRPTAAGVPRTLASQPSPAAVPTTVTAVPSTVAATVPTTTSTAPPVTIAAAAAPSTTAPAPTTVTTVQTPATTAVPAAGVAAAATTADGYGCAAALAYLRTHAAPGFTFECPGNALGHQAMTCAFVAGVCPGGRIIAIADPCPAAYMNEAYNSRVAEGLAPGPFDPYGYCRN